MPLYQSIYNGSKVVVRQVKRKQQSGGDVRSAQPVVQLKSLPAPPKEEDKKTIRLKMSQELMRNL